MGSQGGFPVAGSRYLRRTHIILSAGAFVGAIGAIAAALAANGSVSYTYDPLGRLNTASYDTGVCIAYTYDANGNRLTQTVTVSGSGATPYWGCFNWGDANWN